MNHRIRALVFISIFVVHSVVQFMAFAIADSPTHSSALMRLLWSVLAAPLFPLLASLMNESFWLGQSVWIIGIANSVLWAAVLTYITVRLITRHRLRNLVQDRNGPKLAAGGRDQTPPSNVGRSF